MNTAECMQELTESGHIPGDARVVSTNNKIVALSSSEQIVARICDLRELNERDDPHDLHYSHYASWHASSVAPAVRPLQHEPIIAGNYLISSYPLLRSAGALHAADARSLYALADSFGHALHTVQAGMQLRRLDVQAYVGERLDNMQSDVHPSPRLLEYVRAAALHMRTICPFEELTQADSALVHGDFKTDNLVKDCDDSLKIIDLDAVAVGPRLYDIASWRLRAALGDDAPVEAMVEVGRSSANWNEDAYRSLIGWKAISSMSFTLRYEAAEIHREKTVDIAHQAARLRALPTPPEELSA